MKPAKRTEYTTRHAILNLLSEEEFARVNTLEGAIRLAEGDEYLDLEQLGQGVFRANGAAPMRRVLPKKAVNQATWDKILQELVPPTPPTE
jgi:hypothetical protein